MELRGKRVLVTGASRGIGEALGQLEPDATRGTGDEHVLPPEIHLPSVVA